MLKNSPSNISKKTDLWEWMLLFLALVAGAWRDGALLTQVPAAVGLDGYYYVLQVDSLKENGHLYFSTHTPFILYVLTGMSHLIGNTVLAIKISSITFHTLLCLGICALITSLTHRLWLGALGSLLAIISGLHIYMVTEFTSNLGAMTLLIWSGFCAIRAAQTRSKIWIFLSSATFIAAVFSHKTAVVVGLGIATLVLLLLRAMKDELSNRYWSTILAVILVSWIVPSLMAAQPFIQLPQWVSSELTIIPRLTINPTIYAETILLLIASPVVLLLIARTRHHFQTKTPIVVLGAIALWSITITLNPLLNYEADILGINWRLRSIAYIQVAILIPGLIWLALEAGKMSVVYLTALVMPLMMLSVRVPLPQGARSGYLLNRAEMVGNLPQYRQSLGAAPIVIARHGDQFVATSILGVPSQLSWAKSNDYQTVYWLLHNVASRTDNSSMIVVATDENKSNTILIENGNLQQLLNSLTRGERMRVFAVNPHLYVYLYPKSQS